MCTRVHKRYGLIESSHVRRAKLDQTTVFYFLFFFVVFRFALYKSSKSVFGACRRQILKRRVYACVRVCIYCL
jgi:hypothetical protein